MDNKAYVTEQLQGNLVTPGSAYNLAVVQRATQFVGLLSQQPERPTSILDAGCRGGHALDVFRDYYPKARVVGVDLVPEFIEEAQESGEAMVADLHDLPFKNKEFDWCFSSHTLEHCHTPQTAIRELQRVTKTGMFLIVPLEREADLAKNASHHYQTCDPIEWLKFFQCENWLMQSAYLTEFYELIVVFSRKEGLVKP